MLNENMYNKAQTLLDGVGGEQKNVKRIRREAGLLERQENSEKIILVEDNRQVLFG